MKVKVVKRRHRKDQPSPVSLRNDDVKNVGYDHFCTYEYSDIKDFDTCCTCDFFCDNEMETRFECHKKVRGKNCYENKYER